ncbi:replicase [Sweet potato collusive virus]|uniref:RNA-directed DNA polymerase n=1 Tax=Sweet potato collusive virus TaxID=930168 RepID=E5KBV1_9VIRU|nr:replicase [Sweet potato collusive virus]ADR03142.2 replicase [Sweet potato collusive virus]
MNRMTYMTVKITIPTYMSRIYHGLFDTGANTCVCKTKVLPPEKWIEIDNKVLTGFSEEKNVIKYRADNIKIMIAKKEFIIPYIYAMDNINADIIIGATFYNKYSPITIDMEKGIIKFTNKGEVYPNYLVKYPRKKVLIPWEKGNPSIIQPLQNEQINNINEVEELNNILGEDIYGDNPLKHWEKHKTYAKIELKNPDDHIYKPPINYQESDYKEFKMHIDEMVKEGFIEECKNLENKKYSSPAFIVNKHSEIKRGKSRMVIDYKDLNKKAKVIKHPIPNKDILINRGIKANYFSKFDCKSGFYHIKLEEDSKKYTAFTVPQGYYVWIVLPFGYHNSPSIYQQFMDGIFRPYYDFILVYIDDILIFSKTYEEHKIHLEIFRNIIIKHGIVLSKKKAEIGKQKIEFLGVKIEQGGIELQPHIIDKILEKHIKIKSKKELQSILGLVNQIRNFLPNLSKILLPIQKKLKIKNEEVWEWTKEDEQNIIKLKDYCKDNVIKMTYPVEEKDMNWIIEVDASKEYYGNCLKYKKDKIEYICRYNSGTFKEHEKNYDINRKELIAIYKGLEHYAIFTTQGKKLVRTDNSQAYYWIKNSKIKNSIDMKNVKGILAKIIMYDFDIEIIDGKTNIVADFLSRNGTDDATITG